MLVVEVVAVAGAWVRVASGAAVLVADGILVDRGIGLGCAVVRRGDAVTGLTAVVAVPVIHSTVWVFICTEAHGKRKHASVFLMASSQSAEIDKRKDRKKEKNIMKEMIPTGDLSCGTKNRPFQLLFHSAVKPHISRSGQRFLWSLWTTSVSNSVSQ